jgi:pimeloyl-ACP methyl ester carboxylesterase
MRTFFLALLLALPLNAQTLWGDLQPGPYTPGYTQWDRYDHSRPFRTAKTLDGKPRNGERGRPIRISIWYPAQQTPNAQTLTFGDYADMLAGEARFGAVTAEQKRRAEETFWAFPLLNTLKPEHRAKMRTLKGRAVRDAKPVDGKFPVILYSLGSTVISHATPEYLASHGYVVVQSPRLGAYAGLPQDNRDVLDLEMKLRDMDFLLNEIRKWRQADPSNLGAIGFSAGGRWALAAAMKYPDVKAVVSLDSVMLFPDAVNTAWRTMPHFSLDAVRVPVLHLTRTEFARQDDMAMWNALRYADRTYVEYTEPSLDHWDFQSLGYATALAGARGEHARHVADVYHAVSRQTLGFLDAHLKGKSFKAEGPKVTHAAAIPAPISAAEFMNAIDEEGAAAAIAGYRAEARNGVVAEPTVNAAGYVLMFQGRQKEAIEILTLNTESFPASANAYDSLADAYVAIGDRAKALELTKKAAELLAKETGMTPERRAAIQGSIDAKLKQLSTP